MILAPAPSDLTDEVVATLRKFVQQGKTKSIGLGMPNVEDLKAIDVRYPGVFDVFQFEQSLLEDNSSKFAVLPAFQIGFGSISGAYKAILKLVNENGTIKSELEDALHGKSLTAKSLASIMIQFAASSPGIGCVHLSSQKADNIRANAKVVNSPEFSVEEISDFRAKVLRLRGEGELVLAS